MVDNYILRANARKQLGGNIFANKWILCLVMFFIYDILISTISLPVNILSFLKTFANSITFKIISFAADLLSIALSGAFALGLVNGCLKIVENDNTFSVSDLFSGFKRFWQTFLLNLMQSIFIVLWTLLFIIPGFIKTYSYSMSFYLLRDNPDFDWREAIDESREIMDGHKLQLFLLDLSFIGWYVLGLLCLGVGVLFVVPYHQVARANFYEALIASNEPLMQS